VKGDHLDKLKNFCIEAFGEKFYNLMYAKAQDFEKHIKCVQQLDKQIQIQPNELVEVLDLIFKWGNLRLTESSNTKLLLAFLDFYSNLVTFFIEIGYTLQEFEALVFVGTLVNTSGVNNKTLQEKVRKLIRQCYDIYDKKATYRILISIGVVNQNQKTAAECLDEISWYINANGVDHVTKKDFQLFVTTAEKPDKSVRENSLKVFGEAYAILGEQVWRLIKDVPIKVKGLLEQRFKQIAKTRSGLDLSMGSAKGGQVRNTLAAAATNPRNTVAPALQSSNGLVFKRPEEPEESHDDQNRSLPQEEEKQALNQTSESGSMAVTNQLNQLDVGAGGDGMAQQCADDVDRTMTFGNAQLEQKRTEMQ